MYLVKVCSIMKVAYNFLFRTLLQKRFLTDNFERKMYSVKKHLIVTGIVLQRFKDESFKFESSRRDFE